MNNQAVSRERPRSCKRLTHLHHPLWEAITGAIAMAIVMPLYGGYIATRSVRDYIRWRGLWPNPPSRFRREIQTSKNNQVSNIGLFARLPYEIRCQIFKHLTEERWNRRALTTSTRCLATQSSRSCSRYNLSNEDCDLTNLLRTCRGIYAEASFLLYTSSTLKVEGLQDIANFTRLSRTISKNNLTMVRKLSVNMQAWKSIDYSAKQLRESYLGIFRGERFRYPYEFALDSHRQRPWRKLWHVVATKMPNLEDLSLVLEESWSFLMRGSGCTRNSQSVATHQEMSLVPDLGQEWIEPLLWIRGLKSFRLELWALSADPECRRRFADLEKGLQRQMCSA